ncbi:hypothetical protein C8J56DRAFT_933868 [Mycena floridula]|nr:hypothetical protein C8J56DRAFT_933868 [Mycena floridula]
MESTRTLISYDDITAPYNNGQSELNNSASQSELSKPPAKKPKKKHRKSKQRQSDAQHTSYKGEYDENVENSRELTFEDVWDDSALIDAWNAATEEYEAFNGPAKGWKTDPVNKSSLWYNIPPSDVVQLQSTTSSAQMDMDEPVDEADGDSKPLDFDTFVPTHDPALDLPVFPQPLAVPGPDYSSHYLPMLPGSMVSRDEAFNRALGAMYWGGYWTAVYHCQNAATQNATEMTDEEEEAMDEEITEVEDDGFVSTQR